MEISTLEPHQKSFAPKQYHGYSHLVAGMNPKVTPFLVSLNKMKIQFKIKLSTRGMLLMLLIMMVLLQDGCTEYYQELQEFNNGMRRPKQLVLVTWNSHPAAIYVALMHVPTRYSRSNDSEVVCEFD
jgi:hypothetical protein